MAPFVAIVVYLALSTGCSSINAEHRRADRRLRRAHHRGGAPLVQRIHRALRHRRLAAHRKLRESGAGLVTGVSIRPGTEYEVRLAYHRQGGATRLGGLEVNETYLETIRDDSFELVLSNLPVRHVVRVATS